jgi:hypothetical protein
MRPIDADFIEFAGTLALGGAAMALTVYTRMTRRHVIVLFSRVILLLLTLGFCAGAAEIATRIIFRDVTTSSDNGGFFSRRWYRSGPVHENHAGFRGREFAEAKPPGVYRIAIVGDSFTYGNGVRQEDRYSDLLQAELPSHIEVLNFGTAGANTPEHLATVTNLLQTVHPDFVLLQWYVNDVEDDDAIGRPRSSALMPIRAWHNWLNDNSALYTVANMQWAETQVALGLTESYAAYLRRLLGDPGGADAKRDAGLLRDLINRCKQANVPIGIILFPDTAAPIDKNYPFGFLHERVLATCSEMQITCIDLREDFAPIKDRRTLWASRLDHHPSAKANAIATERILKTYSGQWAASSGR